MAKNKPSAALWILPILLGIIGGIIAWAVAKDRDPKMARNMLLLGLILTVLGVIVQVVLLGAFLY